MSKEGHAYEFGPYRLLPSERLLLREGEPVALAPKAFETLVALVRRAGRLSDKEVLLKEVWPDAFVEESNLTQNVFALRRALGPADNGKPYIETVPKRGYRFLAAVTVAEDHVKAPAPAQPAVQQESAPAQPADQVMRPARSRAMAGAAAIVGVIALIGVAALLVKMSRRPAPAASFQTMKMVRLTTSGKVFNLAISPDGKYVVYGLRDGGQQSLWVRQTATQSVVQVVAPAPVAYVGLTFSSDGNFIFYNAMSRGSQQPRVLFRVPTLGGTPVQVLDNLRGGAISVSPDGRQIAFIRIVPGTESVLMIASADGTGARRLVTYKSPPEELDAPAWSPDGKRIAYAVVDHRSNDSTIVEADVANGTVRPVTARRWLRIIKLAWLSDGRGLLALATPGENFVYQVWQLSYPDGEAQRLTNDLNSYGSMSLSAGTDTLAVLQSATEANIWLAPANDPGRLRAVTSGAGKTDGVSSWTPDGRIVYHSTASGTYDIWITRPDGGPPQQLTSDARINQGPAVSPDGRSIVFLSDRTGAPHLWRMNLDGSDQRQLTNGASGEQNPRFSPDGRWLVYRTAFGRPTAWKMPAGGGEAVQLTGKISQSPIVSPDGTRVAYVYREDDGPPRLAVAPFGGGGPARTFALPSTADRSVRWTPDGRALAYLDAPNGVSNIFAQPLDGGAPVPLTSFTADRIVAFAWSLDGKQLALSRGTIGGDVVLIKDFR